MKYLIVGLVFLASFAGTVKKEDLKVDKKCDSEIIAPSKWELVWEDNFDVDGLPDQRIWNYEEGYIRNNEAQYYTKERLENARVENGNLVIEARKDNWNGHKIANDIPVSNRKRLSIFYLLSK